MACSTPDFPVLHHLRVCSNSCPGSQSHHSTISPSVARFSSCSQSSPASGTFPMSRLLIQKHQFFGTQPSLWSNSHIHMWLLEKHIALTRWTFVNKVMSLIFNLLSRFVIAFLPRTKCLWISWLQSLFTVILEPKKIVCHCFHFPPIYLPWSDGTSCYDLNFLSVEF